MNPTPEEPPKNRRRWFLILTIVLAAIPSLYIRAQPELERNAKNWLATFILLFIGLMGAIWFFFLGRFEGKLRLRVAGLGFLTILVATQIIRIKGTTDGSGLPRLVWRWADDRLVRDFESIASTAPSDAVESIPNVPQFFGPHRDGLVSGARIARYWGTNAVLLWRQKIGAGWSSFAVDDGRAYTQEQQGDDEQVTCYNIRNGHLLWAHTNHAHFSQWQGGDGPRSTPSVEQGLVYAIGATGILDCLDASSGKRVWSRDVLTENQLPNLIWGISCSPLLVDDLVVVTGGLTNRATVLAYDRATGEPKWQAGTDKASYASPVAATIAGQKVILSVNAASLTIHDRQTGAVLLDYPWTNDHWPKAAQPVVLPGDRVFLSSGYAAGCVLLQLTLGNDGKFAKFELWKNMSLKTQFNSAIARDGFLYGLDDGLLACVEVSTGLRRWKDGRYGAGQILLVDDFILVQSEPGPVYLVAADPNQFIELNHLPALGSKTWNYPTLAGRYLLVRNDQAVSCYQLPVQNTLVPGGNRALRGEAGQP